MLNNHIETLRSLNVSPSLAPGAIEHLTQLNELLQSIDEIFTIENLEALQYFFGALIVVLSGLLVYLTAVGINRYLNNENNVSSHGLEPQLLADKPSYDSASAQSNPPIIGRPIINLQTPSEQDEPSEPNLTPMSDQEIKLKASQAIFLAEILSYLMPSTSSSDESN